MKAAVIIFSGYNPRAVIAFLRTLEKNNIQYGIIAKSSDDEIFLTKYSKNVLAVRNVAQLDLNDLQASINTLQEKLPAKEYVIAPSTEALNRFLLSNRAFFDRMRCMVPLVDETLYQTISDKQAFGDLCNKNGILVPAELSDLKTINPPFVAKPKTYFASDGQIHTPVIIKSQKDKINFMSSYNVKDFYFQEFVGGRSLYLLYYFSKNGQIAKFSQENLIQQPDGKSIVGAVSSKFHYSDESKIYEKLFKSISFWGLVMVEVKEYKGNYYMIEANPRFWGPSQLFVDANVNLFEAFLGDLRLLSIAPVDKEPTETVRYFWHGGIMEVNKEPQVVFHNYSLSKLNGDLPDWLNVDVYKRQDTINLYEAERKIDNQ